MKKVPFLLSIYCAFLALLVAPDAKAQYSNWFKSSCPIPTIRIQSATPIGPSPESWKLVFADEFNDNSIDRTKWETKFPNPGVSERYRAQEGPVVFNDGNVTENNGYATIQVREEANPVPYGPADGRLTGGVLFTKDIPSQRFDNGKFEIRCRFPYDPQRLWLGHGLWPAFWLIGGECGREEIDIFELNDSAIPANVVVAPGQNPDQGLVLTTLHGIAGGLLDEGRNIRCENCIGDTPKPSTFNHGYNNLTDGNFHTFAVEWEPACITWYIDGNPVKIHHRFYDSAGRTLACSVPAGENFQHPLWPFKPLQLVIDMKLGEDARYDPAGRAPANLDIDYVRAYQRIPVNDPRNLCRTGVITGNSTVCAGNQATFTIGDLPADATVQWSISPAGAANPVGGSSGSTFTIAPPAGSGTSATVQAQVTTPLCGVITRTMSIHTGAPQPPYVNQLEPLDGCNNLAAMFQVTNFDPLLAYNVTTTGGLRVMQRMSASGSFVIKGTAGGSINVTASNACGSETSYTEVVVEGCGNSAYSVSPNPASEEVQISESAAVSDGASPAGERGIGTVKIYDSYGQLRAQQQGNGSKTLRMGVATLPAGLYVVHILRGQTVVKRQQLQITK